MESNNKGILYIVATPIGNMGDITLRAIETLKQVDLVACEDTRVTGLLMHKLEIKKPLKPLHQHSLEKSINEVIQLLSEGQNVAYVTDCGTPGISDPGQRLIAEIRNPKSEILNKSQIQNIKSEIEKQFNNLTIQQSIQIIPIPGASAVTSAISVSGMVEKDFYFAGFLPKKKGRQTELKYLATLKVPIVIYESAFRLEKTLNDLSEYLGGGSQVSIAREMTKMFEEYWSGSLDEVIADLPNHKIKGELVLIVRREKA